MMGDGVTLRRVCEEHMTVVTDLLRKCGHHVEFNERGDTVTIIAGNTPKCGEIKTAPYPGYPTDMQAQMTALFATTPGISVVKDTIFRSASCTAPSSSAWARISRWTTAPPSSPAWKA